MRVLNAEEKYTTCEVCGAEIEYFGYEEEYEIMPPFVEYVRRYYITCPVCKKKIILRRE